MSSEKPFWIEYLLVIEGRDLHLDKEIGEYLGAPSTQKVVQGQSSLSITMLLCAHHAKSLVHNTPSDLKTFCANTTYTNIYSPIKAKGFYSVL